MKSPLRILYLEDDPRDTELVQETLVSDGIECQVMRFDTEADFIASLEQGGFDLILADYSLPSFDGLSALKIGKTGHMCPSSLFLEPWAKKWPLRHSRSARRIMFSRRDCPGSYPRCNGRYGKRRNESTSPEPKKACDEVKPIWPRRRN